MRSKFFVILMLVSASLAGCLGTDDDDDVDDVAVENGAMFVYIQSHDYAFGLTDHQPLTLHFTASPMADNSPYELTQICSVEDGHAVDVYSTWVNSSGGNAGDFNNITSWGVENTNGIQLDHFSYEPMSDIIGFANPMVVFEDDESWDGHIPAVVYDQATWACTDAVGGVDPADDECPFDPDAEGSPCEAPECEDHESEACDDYVEDYCETNPDATGCDFEIDDDDDDDMVCYDMVTHTVQDDYDNEADCEAAGYMWTAASGGPGDECPFDPDAEGSPCAAPECEDHESEACDDYVEDYCETNPDATGCEFMEFIAVGEFMDTIVMDVSGMCGTMSEMGTSMMLSGPEYTEDGDIVIITFTRIVEYDGDDTRSMMWYNIENTDMGISADMGMDMTMFSPSPSGSHAMIDTLINLHLVSTEELEDGSLVTTEEKLILRDNYTEASDICDEFGGGEEDEGTGSQSFWCSSTPGGVPDTEIPFGWVNDGYEDCGDGADEPQDMDTTVDSDGDGITDNDVDNWLDCNDGNSTTVPMDYVNDGYPDCPNGADEADMDVEITGLDMPDLDDSACGGDDEDGPDSMPTSATMEGPDADGITYVNMTFGEMDADDYCSMEITAMPVGPDSNMTMLSMVMTNGSTTISMSNWFEVNLDKVEVSDGEWEWGAADLTLMTTNSSIHMFDCGEDGVIGDDGEVIDGSQWIIFYRVNDNIADCADQSDEAIDEDGDGHSEQMFHCETPDDTSDDISMYLVNDGNPGDCANGSDEYSQTGSSYGTFNWDSTDTIPDGFTSNLIIYGFSDHDISTHELELRILMTDSAYDTMTEDGQCGDMTSSDKSSLSVLLSLPFDDIEVISEFTDANGKTWHAYYVDNDENGYVNNGDAVSIHSADTQDLYFTCVEIHDSYVDMYTGDTPNMMSWMPGFTAMISLVALLGALFVAPRRD